jgi:hypothetical protein
MTTTMVRFAIAIALAAGAWFSWSEARLAARMADATRQIVTLRYSDVDRNLDAVTTATASYWLGQYGSVASNNDDDAAADVQVLLTIANAAFRQTQRANENGAAAVQRLDGVLQAYASALKASPQSSALLGGDASQKAAAYNYEFVARLRDRIARAPQGKPIKAPLATAAAAMAGDLPIGPTIHGNPGAQPPEAKMEDLQMLAPMEYGDREAQPEATPGGKRERKG